MAKVEAATPIAQGALRHILAANDWTQEILAERSGLHRSVVSMHLNGDRPIRAEHVANYMRALERSARQMFVAAWLRDVVGNDFVDDVFIPKENRIRDEIKEWAPQLEEQDQRMLSWLVGEFPKDRDLLELVRSICRRSGYK